jgi:hypothetical protein
MFHSRKRPFVTENETARERNNKNLLSLKRQHWGPMSAWLTQNEIFNSCCFERRGNTTAMPFVTKQNAARTQKINKTKKHFLPVRSRRNRTADKRGIFFFKEFLTAFFWHILTRTVKERAPFLDQLKERVTKGKLAHSFHVVKEKCSRICWFPLS